MIVSWYVSELGRGDLKHFSACDGTDVVVWLYAHELGRGDLKGMSSYNSPGTWVILESRRGDLRGTSDSDVAVVFVDRISSAVLSVAVLEQNADVSSHTSADCSTTSLE